MLCVFLPPQEATFELSDLGIKIVADKSKSMQAKVFLRAGHFSEYRYVCLSQTHFSALNVVRRPTDLCEPLDANLAKLHLKHSTPIRNSPHTAVTIGLLRVLGLMETRHKALTST